MTLAVQFSAYPGGTALLRWSTVTFSLCSMADGLKRLTETTNIDNEAASPSSRPIYLLLKKTKKNWHSYSTATSLQCGNRIIFIRLTAIHSLEKTKPASGTPPMDQEWLEEVQVGGGGDCLAALVVHLYCAPVIGLCRGRERVSVRTHVALSVVLLLLLQIK